MDLVSPSVLAQGIVLKTVSLRLVRNPFFVNMVPLKANRLLVYGEGATKDPSLRNQKVEPLNQGIYFPVGLFLPGGWFDHGRLYR